MPNPAELQTFMDRLAIRERVDLYIDLLNHRDWENYGDLLTEDAVWSASAPFNQRIEGRKAMVEMVSTVQQYQFGFVFQMGHGLVIDDLTETSARSRHTLHIVSDKFTMLGIYYDVLAKEPDGIWRFKRRDYQVTYHEDQGLPGKVFRTLPDKDYRALPR